MTKSVFARLFLNNIIIVFVSLATFLSALMLFIVDYVDDRQFETDMKEAENEYIFYDDYVKEYTKAENYNAEADIQYKIFKKVYETGEYLFLYKNNNQVYIVEKSTIENGTVGELRSKLMSCVGDKYYTCKY